ncbi:MAG: hypothetical protein HUN04_02375 [Desulfobacter sp.]|nr:MAG: hypothetical protein HUN04_02375 [Desulfobacter sp.]
MTLPGSNIFAISKLTFKENIRNQSFLSMLVLAIVLYFFIIVLSMMAVGDTRRVVLDGGFWILGIIGLTCSVLTTINTIQGDIRKKIVYMVLSRPINRSTLILGKFMGIISVMFLLYAVLSVIFIGLLYATGTGISGKLVIALGSIFFEWIVLGAFGLLFAVFTSPVLNGVFLAGIYFIGHWTKYIYAFAQNTKEPVLKKILIIIYMVFPNLEALNYRLLVIYNQAFDPTQIFMSIITGVGWMTAAIYGAIIILKRKKLI